MMETESIKYSLIPAQKTGSKLDVHASIESPSPTEALMFFEEVKHRLLDVNAWGEICKLPSATFMLFDEKAKPLKRLAAAQDYIRIDVPGPGTKIGKGYDWVKIEQITTKLVGATEILSMTVRPIHHPLKPETAVAHFFTDAATSTFQVEREGRSVSAFVHGRNELPNNKEGFLIDKLRNTIVAVAAKMGFSYPQWKLLVNALVRQ